MALAAARSAKRSHETAFGMAPALGYQPGPPAPAATMPGACDYAPPASHGYDP